MEHFKGEILRYEPGDRLFVPFWRLMQLLGTLSVAQMSVSIGRLEPDMMKGDYSFILKWCLFMPLREIVRCTVDNIRPDSIELKIDDLPEGLRAAFCDPPARGVEKHQMSDLNDLCGSVVFVSFYETYKPFIDAKWQNNIGLWPPAINFARVVRNSISHGGAVSIEKPESPGGSWRTLSYSHANNGEKLIGEDMYAVDLAFLMMDMAEALDDAGAPIL